MFENIEFLQSAYTICFGIAIAFAVLAVALFFLLDIREIFLIETGRAQRKTVEEMHHRNQKTGKLRDDTVADLRTEGDATAKSTASEKTESAGGFGGFEAQRGSTVQVSETGSAMPAAAAFMRGESTEVLQEETSRGRQTVQRSDPGIPFRVTQKTIVIHTDEKIPL